MSNLSTLFLTALCLVPAAMTSQAQTFLVFTNDSDGALPEQVQPGIALLTRVQGYAGAFQPATASDAQFVDAVRRH